MISPFLDSNVAHLAGWPSRVSNAGRTILISFYSSFMKKDKVMHKTVFSSRRCTLNVRM